MMDGKTVRNMQSVVPKLNIFEALVHLVGFTVQIQGPAEIPDDLTTQL